MCKSIIPMCIDCIYQDCMKYQDWSTCNRQLICFSTIQFFFMSNMNKSPPLLSKSRSYDDWLKLITIWQQLTTLELEKQGPAIERCFGIRT